MQITIVKITEADPDNSTDICHEVHLSDGRTIYPWAGKPCYTHQDEIKGPMEVGAVLDQEIPHEEPYNRREDCRGDRWVEYCFRQNSKLSRPDL